MKRLIVGLLLVSCFGCSDPSSDPNSEKPDKTDLTVKSLATSTVNSGDVIRIDGTGFDTNVTLWMSEVRVPIDTLSATQLVFRAPWPRGSYPISVRRGETNVSPGDITVVRDPLASVDIEDGWYKVSTMKASGTSSSSGWYTWNSRGETSTYTFRSAVEDTAVSIDDMPWVQVIGDSLIGRSSPTDAAYFGLIDRANARIINFTGKHVDGNMSTGFYTTMILATSELDVSGSGGKFVMRAHGLNAFNSLGGETNAGNPRPSHSTWSSFSTPNSMVEIVLEKAQ